MNCNYPDCNADGIIPLRFAPIEIRCCDEHFAEMYRVHFKGKNFNNVNLGQTLDKWTHVDKKTGRTLKHRISVGKNWEIANRQFSKDDGITVINKATGKNAEY